MENIQQNQGLKQKDEQFVWHAMKGAHQADSLIAQKAEGAWVTTQTDAAIWMRCPVCGASTLVTAERSLRRLPMSN